MITNEWTKSTYSDPSGSCVQVREDAGNVQVRDSKDPNGSVLTFTPAEWNAFIQGVQAGELTL